MTVYRRRVVHRLISSAGHGRRTWPASRWRCLCGSRVEIDGIIVCAAQARRVGPTGRVVSLGTVGDVWEADDARLRHGPHT